MPRIGSSLGLERAGKVVVDEDRGHRPQLLMAYDEKKEQITRGLHLARRSASRATRPALAST